VAVSGILLLALLARHQSNSKLHYYLLELAVICGIIFDALAIHSRDSFFLYFGPSSTVEAVMNALTLLLTQLAGLWALHFSSENYIGNHTILASIPSILGTLWVIVIAVLIIVVREVGGECATLNAFTTADVICWAYPALSIWSVLCLIFVRVSATRTYSQQYGIIRQKMTADWDLLAAFIILITLYIVWMIVMEYCTYPNNAVGIMALVDLILSILLTKLSLLLFIGIYDRLSAMVPIDERIKIDREVEETRSMYNL
jgi:hypothetical protein